MIERFIDKYYWADRYSRVSTNLALFIGNKLCNGYSLANALKAASEEVDNRKQKIALSNAEYLVKKGEDLRHAFSDYSLKLKQKDRFVLASSLSDRQKGIILKNWSESKFHGSNAISYLLVFITTIVICSTAFFASSFVLPQFYEISLGMDVPTNNLLKVVYRSYPGLFFLFLLFYFGFICFLIVICFSLNNMKKEHEEADLLALISSFDRSEQLKILDMMANSSCFPRIHKNIRRAVESLKNGEKQEDSFNNIGLSHYTEWLLNLSYYENDRAVLKEGAMIINERIMLSSLSKIKIAEVLIVILQSMFFALMASVLFGSLNNIVLGCFA
ncbi:MAG: hypothetical protein IKO19_04080 [Candidatus Riflebacteria bacterium]|nr:hypothetical protein [Candidatus Riflebacteria bacterium]